MRISIPTLPSSLFTPSSSSSTSSSLASITSISPLSRNAIKSVPVAIDHIASFLSGGNTCVLTGAGVSVDSGIRAYRGKDGRYLNEGFKPILYQQLVDDSEKGYAFRQRYWLRSYLGYPTIRAAQPNPTHFALAALQHSSLVPRLVTQNVDGLHLKALFDHDASDSGRSGQLGSMTKATTPADKHRYTTDTTFKTSRAKGKARGSPLETSYEPSGAKVLELHGTLHKVHCTHHHHLPRSTYQDLISYHNPQWEAFALENERLSTASTSTSTSAGTGSGSRRKLRMNPDGDVMLEGVAFDEFIVPECIECAEEGRVNSILKPDVIFFGESISQEVRDLSYEYVESCDRLFLIGTTMATFSAFRLLKHALSLHKPTLILNVGPTRADSLSIALASLTHATSPPATRTAYTASTSSIDPSLMQKIELRSGDVLREAVRAVLGTNAYTNPTLERMLRSGIVQSPDADSSISQSSPVQEPASNANTSINNNTHAGGEMVDEATTEEMEDAETQMDTVTGANLGLMPARGVSSSSSSSTHADLNKRLSSSKL